MANGKPFDRRQLTAAAWSLPLGTMVRVINLKNGNSVNVTITDRGPNPRLRRLIDLSEAAAAELDYVHEGVAPVCLIPLPSAAPESAPITAELIEPATTLASYEAIPEVAAAAMLLADKGAISGLVTINGQAERRLDVEIEPRNLLQGPLNYAAIAGF